MLSLLLSSEAAEQHSRQIADALSGLSYKVIELESLNPTGDAVDFDAAFLSRDITGAPKGPGPSPARVAFVDLLRRSLPLRWVHIHQAGADAPVWSELQSRGVTVTTSQGANATPVALSALGGVIALERRFPELFDAQRRRRWEQPHGSLMPRDLEGQRATVVGLGPVGREIARLLRAVGMQVTGVRRSAAHDAACDRTITYGELESCLPLTDWLVLACPLTAVTRGLVNGARLALLPSTARVVNVSRGAVVVEEDLIEALANRRLGGAYLDVFSTEPLPPESPLWDMPGVMVSPHAASFSQGNATRVAEVFLENLRRWGQGRPLINNAAALR